MLLNKFKKKNLNESKVLKNNKSILIRQTIVKLKMVPRAYGKSLFKIINAMIINKIPQKYVFKH